MNRGFTDQAAVKDHFNIANYYSGLSRFITSCNTPMTIGIQGDWGTGKTSIMRMIDAELKQSSQTKVRTLWFNTWQFSQFDMGNDLALSLISTLFSAIVGVNAKKNTPKEMFHIIGNLAKKLSVAAIGSKFGTEVAEVVNSAVSGEEKEIDLPEAIARLKEDFSSIVDASLASAGMDRYVIFVDDLDRLQPGKAIELLEVLKLFLDIKNCVFVLAIDYQVVLRGVAMKYGESIGEDKGKSFFDKIIQVPFKMPISHYDITKFIQQCFADIGISVEGEDLGSYESMILSSVGYNPRGMKRLFNAFLLLTHITPEELMKDSSNKNILFAFLCLQQSNDVMYDYIVRERDQIRALWPKLLERDNEEIREVMNNAQLSEKKQEQFWIFMESFKKLVDTNNDNNLDQKEIMNFRKVLDFSTITSADTDGGARRFERKQLNSLEELVQKTMTIEPIQALYRKYAQRIRELVGDELEEKYFAGQSSVSFYFTTPSGKSKKLCEIQLNKTALSLYLVYKVDQFIIDRIEAIKPGIHNNLGHSSAKINGIVDETKFEEILDLIRFNHQRMISDMA